MKYYGTVEQKVRTLIEAYFDDCEYLFADYSQSNEVLDRIEKPTILYLLPPSGTLAMRFDVIYDIPETQIWFICPSDFDFDGHENDSTIERMKRLAYKFIYHIEESGLFKPLPDEIPYRVGYDLFDDNLTGICLEVKLEEAQGLPLCNGEFERHGWDKEIIVNKRED